MIKKEDILNIKKIKGQARGQTIKNAFSCIEIGEGKEGLARLKKSLKELDCWLEEYDDFKNIKIFKWYPFWYDAAPIIVAADIFSWDEEKIRNFGRCNQKVSFFEKTLLKYFVSLKMVVKLAPDRWKKHYSFGKMQVIDFNPEEKHVVLRLENFFVHPVFCQLLTGYIEAAIKFVILSKNIKVTETKCVFKGDAFHEYLIKWD